MWACAYGLWENQVQLGLDRVVTCGSETRGPVCGRIYNTVASIGTNEWQVVLADKLRVAGEGLLTSVEGPVYRCQMTPCKVGSNILCCTERNEVRITEIVLERLDEVEFGVGEVLDTLQLGQTRLDTGGCARGREPGTMSLDLRCITYHDLDRITKRELTYDVDLVDLAASRRSLVLGQREVGRVRGPVPLLTLRNREGRRGVLGHGGRKDLGERQETGEGDETEEHLPRRAEGRPGDRTSA